MHKHDEQDELEPLLAGLQTREPSPMLDHRIRQTLQFSRSAAAPPRNTAVAWIVRCTALAAALALAGLTAWAVFFNQPTPTAPAPEIARPSETHTKPKQPDETNQAPLVAVVNADPREPIELTWSRDISEHQRYTPAGQPFRAVVREAVRQKTWINPETGESLQISVPREELIVSKQSTF